MQWLCAAIVVELVNGHGRLTIPAARNARNTNTNNLCHRAVWNTLVDKPFVGLAMGGPSTVMENGENANGGQWGSQTAFFPGSESVPVNESTGRPYPVQNVQTGQELDVQVQITAPHKGFFEFSLCTIEKVFDAYYTAPVIHGTTDTNIKNSSNCIDEKNNIETELNSCKTKCNHACNGSPSINQAFMGKQDHPPTVVCRCRDNTRKYIQGCAPCKNGVNTLPAPRGIGNEWYSESVGRAVTKCLMDPANALEFAAFDAPGSGSPSIYMKDNHNLKPLLVENAQPNTPNFLWPSKYYPYSQEPSTCPDYFTNSSSIPNAIRSPYHGTPGTKLLFPDPGGTGIYNMKVKIPPNLSGQAYFLWHYQTGNSKCAYPEMFNNIADITIVSDNNPSFDKCPSNMDSVVNKWKSAYAEIKHKNLIDFEDLGRMTAEQGQFQESSCLNKPADMLSKCKFPIPNKAGMCNYYEAAFWAFAVGLKGEVLTSDLADPNNIKCQQMSTPSKKYHVSAIGMDSLRCAAVPVSDNCEPCEEVVTSGSPDSVTNRYPRRYIIGKTCSGNRTYTCASCGHEDHFKTHLTAITGNGCMTKPTNVAEVELRVNNGEPTWDATYDGISVGCHCVTGIDAHYRQNNGHRKCAPNINGSFSYTQCDGNKANDKSTYAEGCASLAQQPTWVLPVFASTPPSVPTPPPPPTDAPTAEPTAASTAASTAAPPNSPLPAPAGEIICPAWTKMTANEYVYKDEDWGALEQNNLMFVGGKKWNTGAKTTACLWLSMCNSMAPETKKNQCLEQCPIALGITYNEAGWNPRAQSYDGYGRGIVQVGAKSVHATGRGFRGRQCAGGEPSAKVGGGLSATADPKSGNNEYCSAYNPFYAFQFAFDHTNYGMNWHPSGSEWWACNAETPVGKLKALNDWANMTKAVELCSRTLTELNLPAVNYDQTHITEGDCAHGVKNSRQIHTPCSHPASCTKIYFPEPPSYNCPGTGHTTRANSSCTWCYPPCTEEPCFPYLKEISCDSTVNSVLSTPTAPATTPPTAPVTTPPAAPATTPPTALVTLPPAAPASTTAPAAKSTAAPTYVLLLDDNTTAPVSNNGTDGLHDGSIVGIALGSFALLFMLSKLRQQGILSKKGALTKKGKDGKEDEKGIELSSQSITPPPERDLYSQNDREILLKL